MGRGIVPSDAAIHHKQVKEKILQEAFEKSNLTWDEIDVISYSFGPGLAPPLLVAGNFAIELSQRYKKPLIRVHHGIAHIEISRLLTKATDPVILFLSGGHTSLLAFIENSYKIFGETQDLTTGQLLDTIARKMGLPTPGGPEIEKLAKRGKYLELPYCVKGMDVSFSGIETAAINLLKRGASKEDVAYSIQETCFAMLVEVTERAMAHTGKQECLVTGGVAANKRLREMTTQMCKERGAKAFFVPSEYSADNGVQIAWVGLLAYKSGWKPKFKDKILPKWRIDTVEIPWIK